MTLRIVINACVRYLHQSFTVEPHVIMTRKKSYICHKGLNRVMAAKLCTESGVKVGQSPCSTSDPDSDSELGLFSGDTENDEIIQPETIKFLIVGLGNPDRQRTRHSVGMQFVDRVASRLGASWTREMFKKTGGFTASVDLDNNVEIYLLKPRVPMNLNGTSVIKSARFYSIAPENIYLIHDELDKPVGKFQLKDGGSASGHNGVKSVMDSVKSDVMPRLRIGIDRPADKGNVVDYVLEKFTLDEYRVIRGVIDESIRHMFDHMGNKCGVELDINSQKPTSPESDYDSEDELKFRFGKGHKYKNDQRGHRFKNDRRDFKFREDRRDFKFREDRRGFNFEDDRSDFKFREDRRDFGHRNDRRDVKYRNDLADNRDYEELPNPGFKNSRRDFRYKSDKRDFQQKRRNPVYYSDE